MIENIVFLRRGKTRNNFVCWWFAGRTHNTLFCRARHLFFTHTQSFSRAKKTKFLAPAGTKNFLVRPPPRGSFFHPGEVFSNTLRGPWGSRGFGTVFSGPTRDIEIPPEKGPKFFGLKKYFSPPLSNLPPCQKFPKMSSGILWKTHH